MTLRIRLITLTVSVVILVFINLIFGSTHIPFESVLRVLTGSIEPNDPIYFIIIENRLPQALTALFAGASLAVAGLLLQTFFRNPLAGPSILGITSGATLGVAVIVLFFGGYFTIGSSSFGGEMAVTSGAFLGSFLILALLIVMARRIKSNMTLLIIGIMTGYLTSSLVSLLTSVSDARGIQNYVMWGLGNFSSVSLNHMPYFIIICLIGLILAFIMAKQLNLLMLGDNYAANLGVNVIKARFWILVSTGILSAIVTAFCGPIGFIGLAVPHIARLIVRSGDHRILLPSTILCGSTLALICNILSVAPEGNVIPINALTPLAGVPVVLYVILRKNN